MRARGIRTSIAALIWAVPLVLGAAPAGAADQLRVETITAGGGHACAIGTSDRVICWGNNFYGQLGVGVAGSPNPIPGPVTGIDDAEQVSAGMYHTCAIRESGQAVCWGSNVYGQLGDGTETNRLAPTPVSGLADAVAIAAGATHTCAIRASGQAVCWGLNEYGELGDGSTEQRLVPTPVSGLADAVAISAASNPVEGSYSCAIDSAEEVLCWGRNAFGQLGDGTEEDRHTPTSAGGLAATRISTGGNHACAIDPSGQAFCWGSNSAGQVGDESSVHFTNPDPFPVPGLDDAVQISAGGAHTCAVLSSGQALCWGWNLFGQLGDGTTEERYAPTPVAGLAVVTRISASPSLFACAARAPGQGLCWGQNTSGQLGDGTTEDSFLPVSVLEVDDPDEPEPGIQFESVAAGESHSCGIDVTGQAWCWGGNGNGQLGDGSQEDSTTPVRVSGLPDAKQISVGTWHSCAVRTSGQAVCWGSNFDGALGDDAVAETSPTWVPVTGLGGGTKQISAGGAHTCAIGASDQVLCWGWNVRGQLGVDTDEYPDERQRIPVPVDLAVSVAQVSAGDDHTCAVATSGQAWCWGFNWGGKLGTGPGGEEIFGPVEVLFEDGAVFDEAARVSAGRSHSCAIDSSDQAWCWGGFPGSLPGLDDIAEIGAGGSFTCARRESGQVVCWGSGELGQLGNGAEGNSATPVQASGLGDAKSIGVGVSHSCAVRSNGQAVCWGVNSSGQLGDGSETRRNVPTPVVGSGGGPGPDPDPDPGGGDPGPGPGPGPGPSPGPTTSAVPAPAPGVRATGSVSSGTILVRRPGSRRYTALKGSDSIPIGSLVDARNGKVRIVSAADRKGGTREADFYGGIFKLLQGKAPGAVTEVRLAGPLNCPRAKRASASKRGKPGRLVWGSGKGAHRSTGRFSSATVRGTTWLVHDRCDNSTLTRVTEGRVEVRDFAKRKTALLRKGKSYVARPKR